MFKMAISKILDFSAGSKFAIKLTQVLDMTEKVKIVIECNFLLPEFKSRGTLPGPKLFNRRQPNPQPPIFVLIVLMN